MNIHYPVPERANRSILWLLAVTLTLASLLVAYQAISQLVFVKISYPAILAGRLGTPHPLPVPEPPYSQPILQSHVSATPIPLGAKLHPSLQPIPTPPSGQ